MKIETGGSFLGVLFLIFMTLKLTNVINWSWWWVSAPLWGPFALIAMIIGASLTLGAILLAVGKKG